MTTGSDSSSSNNSSSSRSSDGIVAVVGDTFHSDLKQLTDKILVSMPPASSLSTTTPRPEPKLGDVIQHMGRNKLLLRRKKDDDFTIDEINSLSDATRDYLNALQLEKFYHCRLCYNKNEELRCDFHKKYIFNNQSSSKDNEVYIQFLNSEMGIISFVELYYSYLSVPFWKLNAQFLFRDLTGFSSIKELLTFYNYDCADDVDIVAFETMEEEE
jgi:hypothetical protein